MSGGVVIAGGGLAAQRCAQTLRRKGFDGPLRMVCAEPHLPYDRPPLSKAVLAGAEDAAAVALRPEAWYAEHAIDVVLGRSATALRPRERTLVLDDATTLRYGRLLIATGSSPRRLAPLDGRSNVHLLRSLDDALRLRRALTPAARLAVVGAGFIGQEVAATARGMGVEVTLIEAASLPLAPLLGDGVGRWLAGVHDEEGVRVLLSAQVDRVHGNGRVEALELRDGRRVEADAVVVGVGVEPATAWLHGSGLETDAVRTGPAAHTSAPDVFAAGDAARVRNPRTGAYERTEHWDAAVRQGVAAAHGILGLEAPARPAPSFWSDQYGVRLQLVGDPVGHDTVAVDGDPAARDFHAVFHRAGRPVAGLAVNRPHELPRLRRLVSQPERPAA